MTFKESKTIEFKQLVTENAKNEVIAFTNTDGETLLLGIADDGTVVGLKNASADLDRVVMMLKDGISPDLMPFLGLRIEVKENKEIIVIKVHKGPMRPYYLNGKGIKVSSVYVRRGTCSDQASNLEIDKLLRERQGDAFETYPSYRQDLSFETVNYEFLNNGKEFNTEKMISLGLQSKNNEFTNLGLLLSDQCPYSTAIIVFSPATGTTAIDTIVFTGFLLKQLKVILDYIEA
ncbi:MAG: ATP-binding protein [Deltaproteobacteria bacterium]|jgi:ATP-dependent DNA helicase RecG|nr:ATP-binding protein [Deltaproteobacteria bacterium]